MTRSPDERSVTPFGGVVDAVVELAGSKSIANRALACAALCDGRSVLRNMPDGDDTVTMIASLAGLGVGARLDDTTVVVDGAARSAIAPGVVLHAGLAGTTSRFVTALAALHHQPITVDGFDPLRARPFRPLHDALRQLGVDVATPVAGQDLPAIIEGPPRSGVLSIQGDVSSQFVTALMLIGPCLPDGLRIELTTPLVSKPYVDLTVATMEVFGATDVDVTDTVITVAHNEYRSTEMFIEPDASSASYPLAIAAVVGGSITVPGLGLGAIHGDARFADVLQQMGCRLERTAQQVTVGRDVEVPLQGLDIDMADISDLVPTLAVVAAFAESPTRIRGVGFIRSKESDRLGDLSEELRKAGVRIEETTDGLEIWPSADHVHGARLATHHDHRLAMAFAVLGAQVTGIVVEDPEVVAKSWPDFWQAFERLRP